MAAQFGPYSQAGTVFNPPSDAPYLQSVSSLYGTTTAADTAQKQLDWAKQKFGTVWPYVTGQFSALSKQLGAPGQPGDNQPAITGGQGTPPTFGGTPGGATGAPPGGPGFTNLAPAPKINAGPVWTPSQIQQQVNQQVAGVGAQTGTNIKQAGQSLAGRGFGGQSPLLAELTAQAQGQGLQQASQVRQQVPWNAAQANASQLLAGQQAQQAQWQQQQAAQGALEQARQGAFQFGQTQGLATQQAQQQQYEFGQQQALATQQAQQAQYQQAQQNAIDRQRIAAQQQSALLASLSGLA